MFVECVTSNKGAENFQDTEDKSKREGGRDGGKIEEGERKLGGEGVTVCRITMERGGGVL